MGIATNSTQEVGLIFFRALQETAPTYTPRAYLGDDAEAFANAAMTAFPSIEIRLMCFVHVYKVSLSIVSSGYVLYPRFTALFLHITTEYGEKSKISLCRDQLRATQ